MVAECVRWARAFALELTTAGRCCRGDVWWRRMHGSGAGCMPVLLMRVSDVNEAVCAKPCA